MFTFLGYADLGDPLMECQRCGACMWYQERKQKFRHSANPKFGLCCGDGKIQLTYLEQPPELLNKLLFDHNDLKSKHFQQHIRLYNNMFAFSSPGFKVDKNISRGRGPPTIRIQGQSCYRIGSMIPMPGVKPKFAQLYIYDTENELQHRVEGLRYENNGNKFFYRQFEHCIQRYLELCYV